MAQLSGRPARARRIDSITLHRRPYRTGHLQGTRLSLLQLYSGIRPDCAGSHAGHYRAAMGFRTGTDIDSLSSRAANPYLMTGRKL